MPQLNLDQPTLDSLGTGETDTFVVRLEAGTQYRIDIHGKDTGEGTLATAAVAHVYPTVESGPSWWGPHFTLMAHMSAGATPSGTFYFTPQTTKEYDLVVSSQGAGSYSITVHSPSGRANAMAAKGEAGSTLVATAGDDVITMGSFGAGMAISNPPVSRLDGGAGFDVAAVAGMAKSSDWSLSKEGGVTYLNYASSTTYYTSTPHAFDTWSSKVVLTGVEAVETVRGLVYTLDKAHANLPRLYQAALARAPDVDGVAYYHRLFDGGASLEQLATGFIASQEFQRKYGALDNAAFAGQLYQNVLHRGGQPAEIAYYQERLASGAMSREAVLIGFAASPENQVLTASYIWDL